jgi:exodeoxyribonuclease VII large subunit
MIRVLRLRYPVAQVLFAPAVVQGSEAPTSIAAALDSLNEHGEAEVIIVGRGGGSIEELWAFNEEIVARAIARSRIPVISGVGHETDFTIADFVADHRASTPTAAATAAVPDIQDWFAELSAKRQTLDTLLEERLENLRLRLRQSVRDLQHVSPHNRIERHRQQLDEYTERLQTHMKHLVSLYNERLRGLALQLHSLSPLLTIGRGYAVVRRDEDQHIVTSVSQVQPGHHLTVQVQDGYIPVEVLP